MMKTFGWYCVHLHSVTVAFIGSLTAFIVPACGTVIIVLTDLCDSDKCTY